MSEARKNLTVVGLRVNGGLRRLDGALCRPVCALRRNRSRSFPVGYGIRRDVPVDVDVVVVVVVVHRRWVNRPGRLEEVPVGELLGTVLVGRIAKRLLDEAIA